MLKTARTLSSSLEELKRMLLLLKNQLKKSSKSIKSMDRNLNLKKKDLVL